MRLIGDGVVDREGVPGLAHRLGYTPRHLGRMLAAEVGATPLALARARRAHTARVLLTTTSLSIGDIAFAAGFSSIRQFNDTVRDVYATDPTGLRSHGRPVSAAPGTLTLRLAVRPPFAGDELLAFLGARSVSGVEYVRGRTYARTLSLPGGKGTVHLAFPAPGAAPMVTATLRLEQLSDLVPAVDRCRRLLDADADPTSVDAQLTDDPFLAATVRQCPGLRVPGAVDGPEILLRAIFGQQVSVASARSTLSNFTAAVGRPLGFETGDAAFDPLLTRLFPSAADIAALDPNQIPGPRRRAGSIVGAFQAIASGALVVDAGRRSSELAEELMALPGIGPWTAQYVCMRVLGDPDILMTGDLALRQGAAALGLPPDPLALTEHAHRWSPFRSYAGLHLWRASSDIREQPTIRRHRGQTHSERLSMTTPTSTMTSIRTATSIPATTALATSIATPIGSFTVIATDADAPVVLASGWTGDVGDLLPVIAPALRPGKITFVPRIDGINDAVLDYHDGDLMAIENVAVHQISGPFLLHAWDVLRTVKPGRPVTYSEFAVLSGRPPAVRAAASACARNAVALFVPCHRVLRTDGTLGGFRWGLPAKRWLLDHERAA